MAFVFGQQLRIAQSKPEKGTQENPSCYATVNYVSGIHLFDLGAAQGLRLDELLGRLKELSRFAHVWFVMESLCR